MKIADNEWASIKDAMERVLGGIKRIDIEDAAGLKICVYKLSDHQLRLDITAPKEAPNAG